MKQEMQNKDPAWNCLFCKHWS